MSFVTKKILCAAVAFSAISIAHAADTHIITAPSCLLQAANISPQVLARSENLLLLQVNADDILALSDAKHQHKVLCGGFKDVTAKWNRAHGASLKHQDAAAFLQKQTAAPKKRRVQPASYSIRFQKDVNELIKQLNPQRMWNSLETFSSSKDRYADSKDGVAAANWIKTEIETAAATAGRKDVTVYFVETFGHLQPSVVAKIGSSDEPGVVIGAHLDTTSSEDEIKPGADDDGSGSMTVMESARTIIASGMTFNKPIYFIWYSAEELGLVGSQNVVEQFQDKNIPVAGVMHFDMTGFAFHNEPTIWLMKDNIDSELTSFTEQIIKTYTKRPVKYTRCGYACSDHASWNEQGYAAVLPAEARFEDTNPVMHSAEDTIDKLSITHMTDYAKIATAFAVEMAEPAAK